MANVTLTIIPSPRSSIVTLSATGYATVTGEGIKTISVQTGTVITWRVEKTGYTTKTGTYTANETESLNVSLDGDEYTLRSVEGKVIKPRNLFDSNLSTTAKSVAGAIDELQSVQLNQNGKSHLVLTWVGTQAEYNTAYSAGEIDPDWLCYIIDD